MSPVEFNRVLQSPSYHRWEEQRRRDEEEQQEYQREHGTDCRYPPGHDDPWQDNGGESGAAA